MPLPPQSTHLSLRFPCSHGVGGFRFGISTPFEEAFSSSVDLSVLHPKAFEDAASFGTSRPAGFWKACNIDAPLAQLRAEPLPYRGGDGIDARQVCRFRRFLVRKPSI
jgi:hypothetical protein